MDDYGLFFRGLYIGHQSRMRDKDVVHDYLLANGVDSIKVTSDTDYSANMCLGDVTTWRLKLNVFNNRIYYNGSLVS